MIHRHFGITGSELRRRPFLSEFREQLSDYAPLLLAAVAILGVSLFLAGCSA